MVHMLNEQIIRLVALDYVQWGLVHMLDNFEYLSSQVYQYGVTLHSAKVHDILIRDTGVLVIIVFKLLDVHNQIIYFQRLIF